jgi:hypothetical protein
MNVRNLKSRRSAVRISLPTTSQISNGSLPVPGSGAADNNQTWPDRTVSVMSRAKIAILCIDDHGTVIAITR